MTDRELINLAKEASKFAHVPYSKFPVGAALECRGGVVFTGCNIEIAALGCGACRQFLAEFAPDLEVLSAKGERYVSNRLSELLPHTFNF